MPRSSYDPVIRRASADGRKVKLEWTLPNGDRVLGEYAVVVWGRPPAKERARIFKSMERGPQSIRGRRVTTR